MLLKIYVVFFNIFLYWSGVYVLIFYIERNHNKKNESDSCHVCLHYYVYLIFSIQYKNCNVAQLSKF